MSEDAAMMTYKQSQAIWELCRQGFPLFADEAARRWSRGQTVQLEAGVRVGRWIKALIDQCNWEAERLHGAV
jgi:hypothetical protein